MQSCRFDQSAYPVDETVNEVDNPAVPKPFSQIPYCPVLSTGFPPPNPFDPNFKNNTGKYNLDLRFDKTAVLTKMINY